MQRLVLLFAIFYVFFIGGTAYTQNVPFLTFFFHVAASGVAINWLIGKIRRKSAWPQTALDLPLLIYVLVLIIATLTAIDPRVSAGQTWWMLLHVFWFYMLVDVVRAGNQRVLFEAVFVSAGVIVLVSIAEFASWYAGLGFAGYSFGWLGQDSLIPPMTYKLTLALNVSTILGNFTMVLLMVIVAWAMSTARKDYQYTLYVLAVGILLVLIGTQSRGAWAAAVVSLGAMIAFFLMRWKRTSSLFKPRITLFAIAAGTIAMIAVTMGYASVSSSTSDMRREDMWNSTVEMLQDDPFTGVGIGLFGAEYRNFRDTGLIQDRIVSAHNLLFNTMAEIGVLGIILLLWLGVCVFAGMVSRLDTGGIYAKISLRRYSCRITRFCCA